MTYEDFDITEPFPEWAWPSAWMWIEGRLPQVADDYFPKSLPEFVERSLKAYSRTFGLWIHGSLSGAVAFEQHGPVVATAHILLSKRLWGVPATELRKVAALMFETQPELMRLQCYVPVWNRLAVALAKRIGCTVEGTMRAATLRMGKPADCLLLAMTRGEFYGTELRRIDGRDE